MGEKSQANPKNELKSCVSKKDLALKMKGEKFIVVALKNYYAMQLANGKE